MYVIPTTTHHLIQLMLERCLCQVCAHIVQAIRKETLRVQEAWEEALQGGGGSGETQEDKTRSDSLGRGSWNYTVVPLLVANLNRGHPL